MDDGWTHYGRATLTQKAVSVASKGRSSPFLLAVA